MADEAVAKKDKSWLWPKLGDEAAALEAAKGGVVGGGLMILGLLFAVAFVLFSEDAAVFGHASLQDFYVWQAAQVALAAFLTWRVYTGRGRFALVLLLVWIVVEVGMKLASGQMNAGWMIMWFFAILSLIHSVRGSWAVHRMQQSVS